MYKYPTKRLPLELPEAEHTALKHLAVDKNTSATRLILDCLHRCYPELKEAAGQVSDPPAPYGDKP